jgi:cation-transporting ATPase E
MSVKEKYFFTTNNMLMFEFFVSAFPSAVLSLQPNTERVKGKFIPFVISRALPGALTMGLCIFSVYVIRQIPDLAIHFGFINNESEATMEIAKLTYEAIMMLVLTCTGLVMLFRICQPFNVWRTVLYVVSLGLCILAIAVPFFAGFIFEGWGKVVFNLPQYLLLIIIVQAALPMSGGLIRFFDMFNPAD